MSSRNYMGIRFDVWNGQQAWFWLVLNTQGHAGVIGAASKEADAVRDACFSIEEMVSKDSVAENCANHP